MLTSRCDKLNIAFKTSRTYTPLPYYRFLMHIKLCKLIINYYKKIARGKKNDFFRNFLFCCTSTNRDETFLFLSNFHIFSRSEKSWGDQKKRYIERRTNDERTTNERLTNYMNDHKTPSGFSESSG